MTAFDLFMHAVFIVSGIVGGACIIANAIRSRGP